MQFTASIAGAFSPTGASRMPGCRAASQPSSERSPAAACRPLGAAPLAAAEPDQLTPVISSLRRRRVLQSSAGGSQRFGGAPWPSQASAARGCSPSVTPGRAAVPFRAERCERARVSKLTERSEAP